MTCDPTGQPCPECSTTETAYKMRIAVLEEQLRQALAKLYRIATALLGETDVCAGEIKISRVNGGGNPLDDSKLRI